jgi:EAL domain-containing protein (putative c-di-GMP-specific phosphodiesterase class I)
MAKANVLFVDDDIAILRSFERLLKRYDFTISLAENGEEALALIKEQDFDIIVSDISMPGMTGTELLREIRKHDLDVPVVLVTGDPALETAIMAVEHGAFRYLTKPVAPEALTQAIERGSRFHRLARLKREALELLGAPQHTASDKASMELVFERALEKMWLAFQPIVSWSQRGVYGYEALLRTSEKAVPHPGVFLELAEQLERLDDLGRCIRRTASEAILVLPDDLRLFINLHPADLRDPELYDPSSPLSKHADRIVLEVTERASLAGFGDLSERVANLKALGFRVAVDDLGAGYAGLTSVAQLEPEVAKIDMSLVRDVHESPTKATLIRSLSEACRDLGMRVVVEGVEVAEERDTLAIQGCDLMQGYLFGRPVPGFDVVELKNAS